MPNPANRKVLIESESRRIPETVQQLAIWQYLERSAHRMLCGWGRLMGEWENASSLHRHIWDQTEIVRRLRDRIEQFPGGKADAPVHRAFEQLGETILKAPSFEDAIDGVYSLLNDALVGDYITYRESVHQIHDAPTIATIGEVIDIKKDHSKWYRAYRRLNPHQTDPTYLKAAAAALEAIHQRILRHPPSRQEPAARPIGVSSGFQLPSTPRRPVNWRTPYELYPYIRCDFSSSVEARRLFWAIGYMREKNLAIDMLRWLFDGHTMPWEWVSDVSRHLWDESRHGDSGMARLDDWDISLEEVGMVAYAPEVLQADPGADQSPLDWAEAVTVVPDLPVYPEREDTLEPMTPSELYEAVFFVCMIAEQGHFVVKNEAYDDFKDGQDLESAEMMLFDIIDETKHVQYGHKWLPELARQSGIDNSNYRERAASIRREYQEREIAGTRRCHRFLPRADGFPPWEHYQTLLERIRRKTPLTNAATCINRSPKPM